MSDLVLPVHGVDYLAMVVVATGFMVGVVTEVETIVEVGIGEGGIVEVGLGIQVNIK